MDKFNNYYDASHPLHPYTHSLDFTEGSIPPVNALRGSIPTSTTGYHPGEKNGKWIEIEDHRGRDGFVNGEPHTISDFGPLPEGWSETPPPPTTEELFARLRNQRDASINSVLWMRERHNDELALGKETSLSQEQYTALLTYIQALRDLPAQPGAPWDGGCAETPWPELPKT